MRQKTLNYQDGWWNVIPQSKEGKAEVATCQWHVFSNDRSEAEIGKEFRNGFGADLFLQNHIYILLDYDVT